MSKIPKNARKGTTQSLKQICKALKLPFKKIK